MIYATTAQLIIFLAYTYGFIYKQFGILTSISESTYKLKGQKRWYFLVFLWSIAMLNLFQGMGVFGFITAAGLVFTGITIDHKSSAANTRQVHTVGAVSAILSAILGLVVLHGIWFPLVVLSAISLYLFLTDNKNMVWHIEVAAFILILIGYYLK